MALFRCRRYPNLKLLLVPPVKSADGLRILKQAQYGQFKKGRLRLDDIKDDDKIKMIRAGPAYDSLIEELDEKAIEEKFKLLGQSDDVRRVCPSCGKSDFKSQSGFTRHVIQCKEGKGELSGNAGHDNGAGAGSKERQPSASTGSAGHK